jgi:putative ABC transport system substrate-binding protein
MFTRLGAKNLELLRELVPQATVIAALANPINPNAEPQLNDLQVAARALGLQFVTLGASNDAELDGVFPTLSQQQIGALIVTADGYLISRQDRLVNLANRFAVPTIYPLRQYAEAGGLMSYGAKFADAFRQCGNYVGKILKGAKPADLPILQPETYELVINLKTAKQLGLTVSPNLLALADEVIE